MSRDKQIEEIAKEICSEYDCVIPCQNCAYYEYANCRDVKSAEKLYTAGYRKASEVAAEIFAEIDAILCSDASDYDDLMDSENVPEIYTEYLACSNYIDGIRQKFAELKKKYIGEDTNVLTNTEDGE